jgi:deoxyhypusine synthase
MIDFSKISTYPIKNRQNKFAIKDMIPLDSGIDLKDPQIRAVAKLIIRAKSKNAKVILMLGGAVVKVGCSALLIDLIQRGFIDHIALNGGASIHDFEIAMIGATSEDVQNGLRDGSFGMAEETLVNMNTALNQGYQNREGYGFSIAKKVEGLNLPYKNLNILYNAMIHNIPGTVHIAIGGDIIHQHPSCDGAALGRTSFIDFQRMVETVSQLSDGILLNVGSAVNLPEVFLKAVTMVRNMGYDVKNFTTANFDFLNMYRARTRIVEWPQVLGGQGFDIRGNHTETIPTLHKYILEMSS